MSRLADAIGPVYNTAGAQKVLGDVAEQEIIKRRNTGTIIAMKTADDLWIYPVYQFTHDGQVNAALLPALYALHPHPRWSVGLWFVTPNDELDAMTAMEWLSAGHPVKDVTRSAGHTAAAWAA